LLDSKTCQEDKDARGSSHKGINQKRSIDDWGKERTKDPKDFKNDINSTPMLEDFWSRTRVQESEDKEAVGTI